MFDTYKEIFNHRGASYHHAMVTYPIARENEFQALINLADIHDGDVVCDVPSGGGYLKQFIRQKVTMIGLDTSVEFLRSSHARRVENILCHLHALPLRPRSVDIAISLAGLHHVKEKQRLFLEVYGALREGGRLCIADVQEGSRIAVFLDDFVDRHNSMGHQGEYLNDVTIEDLRVSGFRIAHVRRMAYHWNFAGVPDMVAFLTSLFWLDKASPREIEQGLRDYVGFEAGNGQCRMNWELGFIVAIKES